MSDPHSNALLAEIARETMRIVTHGGYAAASGTRVEIAAAAKAAASGTRTFDPEELDRLLDAEPTTGARPPPRVEVTLETTQQAAHRLIADESVDDVAALNFASAVEPGGGFLRGARAQEEDITRCSALYSCLTTQTDFYAFHRNAGSHLYSDRMIYSPRVPFFRIGGEDLVEQPYEASVITAAAPNAKRALSAIVDCRPQLENAFRRRTGKVLALAEAMGHRTLVLGAWGCGAFRNDAVMAADSFGTWIESPRFRRTFDRLVFAVYDPQPGTPSHAAFARRLTR